MSSFAVMLMPLAMAYYLKARDAGGRLAYAAAFLVLEGALLVSLTRSSWAGALAGLGVLAFSRDLRREAKRNIEAHGLFAAAAVSMIVLWPRSTVSVYTPSVYERVRELSSALRVDGNAPYSPLYQRLLIWASAWLMGRENPLWGNGYGLFELFYPFYQGGVLVASDVLRTMRTHGNNAHNEILEAWAQTGILGVGVLLWMWTAFFSACRRRLRNSEDERGRPGDFGPAWTAACAGGVAGMLVDNLLNVSLHFPVPAFLFWWQAGCVMGAPARDEGRWRTLPSGRWPAYAVAALILTACARLAWSEAREWNREVWYFRGFKLLRTGELPAAVDALERARRWDRGDVNADFELGNAYARSGLYPKAAWAYRDALKANAGYDEIYSNLGTVLFRYLGQPAQAEPYYLLSLAINPVALNTYVNLDAVYSRDPRRRADEVELLEGAARLFPDQPIFLKRLGSLYREEKMYDRAMDAWSRALAADPDQTDIEGSLRSLAREAKRPLPPAALNAGVLRDLEDRVRRRDYSAAALDAARRARSLFPRSMKARYYLGNLELIHGRPGPAVELLAPLGEAQPANAALQRNLGEAYLQLGRTDEAIKAFRAALRADPADARARRRLSELGQNP